MKQAQIIPDLTAGRFAPASTGKPWGEWLDGRARRLLQGEHFTGSASSLRGTAYKQAGLRGLRVKTRIVDGGTALDLQAVKP